MSDHDSTSGPSKKKRILAVWSRDVNPKRLAGRTQIIQAIRDFLNNYGTVRQMRINSFVESPSLWYFAHLVRDAVRIFVSGHLPSLQCLLFSDPKGSAIICEGITTHAPDTIYLDGVRTFFVLKRVVRQFPHLHIVVDLDDLMSRRMESLGSVGAALSMGYLSELLPAKLQKIMGLRVISRIIAKYESLALRNVENQIGQWASTVVLVSNVEASLLDARYRSNGVQARAIGIAPYVEIRQPVKAYERFERFIFIGTDSLPQNRLTIEFICELWRRLCPSAEVFIYGQMHNKWPQIDGVHFEGYAPGLESVYKDGSVLFAPGALKGGLKTKVCEAFAFGCAVIGNEITFEGMELPHYPLTVLEDKQLVSLVSSPSRFLDEFRQAAATGQTFVRDSLSKEQFLERWIKALNSSNTLV